MSPDSTRLKTRPLPLGQDTASQADEQTLRDPFLLRGRSREGQPPHRIQSAPPTLRQTEFQGQPLRLNRGDTHQAAQQIVGGQAQDQFLANDVHRLTAEFFHVQGCFDMPQVQFHVPPLSIQFDQFVEWKRHAIQERREQIQIYWAKALALQPHIDPPSRDRWRRQVAFTRIEAGGCPDDSEIHPRPQGLPCQMVGTRTTQPEQGYALDGGEGLEQMKNTEIPVAEMQKTRTQTTNQFYRERLFAGAVGTFGNGVGYATEQIEPCDEAQERPMTPPMLDVGRPIMLRQFRTGGQCERTAIDEIDPIAVPKTLVAKRLVAGACRERQNALNHHPEQPLPRLTIRRVALRVLCGSERCQPKARSDGIAGEIAPGGITGVIGIEPLKDQAPQNQQRRQHPLVELMPRFLKQLADHLQR